MAPLCEIRVFSRSSRYAGTLDVLGLWRGTGALVDYKTGDPRDVGANLQTAAYHAALLEMLQHDDTPDMITFDRDEHRYVLDGERLPSVTQILEWAHIIDFSHVPDPWRTAARHRGTAVHEAAHYYNEGRLDVAEFATTFPSYMPYLQAWIDFRAVSGFTMASTVPENIARYAVRLKKTGKYGVEPYADPTDYIAFQKLADAWHTAAPYFDAWRTELALADAA